MKAERERDRTEATAEELEAARELLALFGHTVEELSDEHYEELRELWE